MTQQKFVFCTHCKNLAGMVNDSGVPMMCCGEKMQVLEPNTVEASTEKHIPVVSVKGNLVEVVVGSVEHPMAEEHHIAWIYLQTKMGGQRVSLPVDGAPRAAFALVEGDAPVAVYEYCNLHGLWKTEV